MGIASALNAATTGLSVTSRLADLVSTNIANAKTPGYVGRDAKVTSLAHGGAAIGSIRRDVDTHLLNERRGADANAAGYGSLTAFFSAAEMLIKGYSPDGALQSKISAFDTSLLAATSRPDAAAYLEAAVISARDIASQINTAASGVQNLRSGADGAIASDVRLLNSTLQQIETLNTQIKAATISGKDSTGLQEMRQQQVELISSIVPIRQIPRENGEISLFTTGGAPLVDGRASTIGFSQTHLVTAEMTLADGPLSGLTLNGQVVSSGLFAGGTLSNNFLIRDTYAPDLQTDLDRLAQDLIERFSQPGLDATLAEGQAGLFTDDGGLVAAGNETGLAQRLSVNASLDGASWKLRDGLGATAPGPAGDSGLISSLHEALNAPRGAAGAAQGDPKYTTSGLVSDLLSSVSVRRLTTESQASFASGRAAALAERESENGVDTDDEMQKLLLIEQAYAANARVIQVLDSMIKSLLEI